MPVRKAIKRNGNAEKENTHREGAPRMSLNFRKGEGGNFLNFDEQTEQNFQQPRKMHKMRPEGRLLQIQRFDQIRRFGRLLAQVVEIGLRDRRCLGRLALVVDDDRCRLGMAVGHGLRPRVEIENRSRGLHVAVIGDRREPVMLLRDFVLRRIDRYLRMAFAHDAARDDAEHRRQAGSDDPDVQKRAFGVFFHDNLLKIMGKLVLSRGFVKYPFFLFPARALVYNFFLNISGFSAARRSQP